VKEKKLETMIGDRDLAQEEKKAITDQLKEMTENYNELQRELQVKTLTPKFQLTFIC
jgi:hypothetical protein